MDVALRRFGASLLVVSLLALSLMISSPAAACLLADRLRAIAPHLSEDEIMAFAHDNHQPEQIPYQLGAAQSCDGGEADIFSCHRVDLESFLPLAQIGGGSGNDLWGWVDLQTGKEYALVGRTNGTAFIDVTDSKNPLFLGNLPSHDGETSTWRDIKVYRNHAFIVADRVPSHGMQVFDLTELRGLDGETPQTFSAITRYTGFVSAHNIVINEASGFAYAVGSNTCAGGLHMIDLSTPTEPREAGCFSADGYTHDAQCVTYNGPDLDHVGKEICFASNEDTVTVVDVSDKASPLQLSRNQYLAAGEIGYTHQGWLTQDQRFFVHDDEFDELRQGHETRTYVWDMLDLDAPRLSGFTSSGLASVDHNQYVRGEFVYQANYTSGLRILRLDDPASGRLGLVGYFDTFPESNAASFAGAWSVYPFFPSGTVLISDISRGLFIVRPRIEAGVLFIDGFESGDSRRWQAEPAAPVGE